MSSTGSLPPRPSLLDLLLTSKRAFLQSQHTYAEATDAADGISRAAVHLLGHHARQAYTAKARAATYETVQLIAKRMEDENDGLLNDELEPINAHRLSLLTSLSATLATLSATPVPASIHRPDPSSTASSSLFGSEAGLSHKADRTSDGQDPVVEDSGRNLRDFIDEQGTEQLMDALDDEQAQIDNLLPTLLALPESLLAKPALESPAPSADPKPAIQDAFTTQAETLEHMRSEMDALANHLEQVSSAVRDEEEGEEVDVLIDDTAHLPSVLDELASCLLTLQQIRSSLDPPKSDASAPTFEPAPHPTAVLDTHTQLHSTIHTHLANLSAHLEAVTALSASLERYHLGFDALRIEVERREVERLEGVRRREAWQAEERQREQDELERRGSFLGQWADSLPSDLWSFSGEEVEGWELRRVR